MIKVAMHANNEHFWFLNVYQQTISAIPFTQIIQILFNNILIATNLWHVVTTCVQ